MRLRVVLALALLFASAATARAQNRAHFADVELVGPVANVVLEVAHQGRTRILGDLAAGETRHVSVPIALVSDATKSAPSVSFDEGSAEQGVTGRARFLAWRGGASPLEVVPSSLRARARPALLETNASVSRAAPLVLVVAACLVLALRRRPLVALVVALAAALVLFPLVAQPERDANSAVTLFDGDLETSVWRRVDAAFDVLLVPQGIDEFELWTEPAAVPVTWTTPLDPKEPWRAEAHGARLFLASVFNGGEGRVTRAKNALVPFDQVWLRDEGEWSAHGAWGTGGPLPGASDPSSPPGWLASNLPQGVTFLIARETAGGPRARRFVRQSGL